MSATEMPYALFHSITGRYREVSRHDSVASATRAMHELGKGTSVVRNDRGRVVASNGGKWFA